MSAAATYDATDVTYEVDKFVYFVVDGEPMSIALKPEKAVPKHDIPLGARVVEVSKSYRWNGLDG